MAFRAFLQATFPARSPGAAGAREKAFSLVSAMTARGDSVGSLKAEILDEKTAIRLRIEIAGSDPRDPAKLRSELTTLGECVSPFGGKLVTLSLGTDSLLPPSDDVLAKHLAATKAALDARTRQLADAHRDLRDARTQLAALQPSRADAPRPAPEAVAVPSASEVTK